MAWDGTHYRPFTYRKARKSLKTGHFPRTRFAWRCQIQLKLAALAYAIGSGPVYWVGPAAKSGQQLVGRIGDNPCMVSDFGVRHNVNDALNLPSGTAEPSPTLVMTQQRLMVWCRRSIVSAQERRMGMLQLWKTLNREPLFSGGPIKEIARETVLLPDGRVIPDYYTAVMGDYAIVYALTQGGNVLILRQHKHGPRRVCLTFPEAMSIRARTRRTGSRASCSKKPVTAPAGGRRSARLSPNANQALQHRSSVSRGRLLARAGP